MDTVRGQTTGYLRVICGQLEGYPRVHPWATCAKFTADPWTTYFDSTGDSWATHPGAVVGPETQERPAGHSSDTPRTSRVLPMCKP